MFERSIRPIALNRKNALRCSDGGGGHWGDDRIARKKPQTKGVDPYASLAEVITRIVAGHRRTSSTTPALGLRPCTIQGRGLRTAVTNQRQLQRDNLDETLVSRQW
ncbi:MAG: hypothetical protein J0H53_19490 [Rhizobiales bacterium]|nr:hypothetical protein [Hyphomicrobiales bacterium]